MNSITYSNQINFQDNQYLLSLITPRELLRSIPDNDLSTFWLKQLTLTNNLAVHGTGDFLLLHCPNHPRTQQTLRLYAPDATNGGKYTYVQTISMDEDLSINYNKGRLVAAELCVYGNTISTTNVALGGSINAVQFQEKPAFLPGFGFSNVLASKRNNRDVINQLPLWNGVMDLYHPSDMQLYRRLETDGTINTKSLVSYRQRWQQFQPQPGNFNYPHNLGAPWITYQEGANPNPDQGILIPDLWGLMKVRFQVQLVTAVIGIGNGTIVIEQRRLSPNDWVTPVTVTTTIPFAVSGHLIYSESTLDIQSEITSIQIYDTTGIQAADVLAIEFEIESYNYYEEGFRGPGTLIAFTGVQPDVPPLKGQVINISGVYNYELVPDSELAKQITTSGSRLPENPFYLDAAKYYIDNGFIKFLYPREEYVTKERNGDFARLVEPEKVMKAAGLIDSFADVMRLATPLLSGVASAVNPMLGAAVSGIGKALGASSSYKNLQAAGSWHNYYSSAGGDEQPTFLEKTPRQLSKASYATREGQLLDVLDPYNTITPANAQRFLDTNSDFDEFLDRMDMDFEKEVEDMKDKTRKMWLCATDKEERDQFNMIKLSIGDPTPTDVTEEFEPEEKFWNNATSATNTYVYNRRVFNNMPFDTITNAFPLVFKENQSDVGYVTFSSAPLMHSYSPVRFTYKDTKYEFNYYSSSNYSETFLKSAICAFLATVPTRDESDLVYLTYIMPDGDVSGASAGLATYLSLMKICGPYYATGTILPNGRAVQPIMLQEKTRFSVEKGFTLMTASDFSLYPDASSKIKDALPLKSAVLGVLDGVGDHAKWFKPSLVPVWDGFMATAMGISLANTTSKGKNIKPGSPYPVLDYTQIVEDDKVTYRPTIGEINSDNIDPLAIWNRVKEHKKIATKLLGAEGPIIVKLLEAGKIRSSRVKNIPGRMKAFLPYIQQYDNMINNGFVDSQDKRWSKQEIQEQINKHPKLFKEWWKKNKESVREKMTLTEDYGKFINVLISSNIIGAKAKKTKPSKAGGRELFRRGVKLQANKEDYSSGKVKAAEPEDSEASEQPEESEEANESGEGEETSIQLSGNEESSDDESEPDDYPDLQQLTRSKVQEKAKEVKVPIRKAPEKSKTTTSTAVPIVPKKVEAPTQPASESAAIMAMLQGMNNNLTGISTDLQTVKQSVKEQGERLTKVEQKTNKNQGNKRKQQQAAKQNKTGGGKFEI